jgi:serine phosphatase RsbU (regulator of sigma subunit)
VVKSIREESMAAAASAEEALSQTVIMRPGSAGAFAPTVDDRAHYLVVVEGEERGRRIEIAADNLVIGRSKPADIVIPDQNVSRNHCRVGLVLGQLVVTDLGSSNGTLVAGRPITGQGRVAAGERISIGSTVLEHEWRSRREVEAASAADDSLEKAKQYVRSLLPVPLQHGLVRTDWVLQPSARLGGDLFGYHFIDTKTFAIYLVDVSGHGADAAMHAVSVMNVLRQRSIPGVDVRDPSRMTAYLNDMFQMESHGGMLLSLWYGVFDIETRTLAFSSAGHHPAYLVDARRDCAIPLGNANVLIGMMPGYNYRSGRTEVPAGCSLYLFSDGAFEVEAMDGSVRSLDEFVPLLTAPVDPAKTESQRLLDTVKATTGRQSFEDDFTLVVATFG